MSQNQNNSPLTSVFVVTCYQNVVGIYAAQETAFQVQQDLISRNRPADVLCRPIVYPEFPK